MIFVDTWAWIGMADDTDQYHAAVIKQHRKLLKRSGATSPRIMLSAS
jgi:predicted nucleic acid-binding protein